jgi:hypothetical protein
MKSHCCCKRGLRGQAASMSLLPWPIFRNASPGETVTRRPFSNFRARVRVRVQANLHSLLLEIGCKRNKLHFPVQNSRPSFPIRDWRGGADEGELGLGGARNAGQSFAPPDWRYFGVAQKRRHACPHFENPASSVETREPNRESSQQLRVSSKQPPLLHTS